MQNRNTKMLLVRSALVSLACALTLLWGCAASSEQKSKEEDDDKEGLRRYEKSFNPVDYDPELPAEKTTEKERKEGGLAWQSGESTEVDVELTSGFRVQVTFTENIEQANRIKGEVAALVTDQPVYVVFEAPYYKVRVGDFLNRPEANLTLRSLEEKGYKDAWIVPDKVRKE